MLVFAMFCRESPMKPSATAPVMPEIVQDDHSVRLSGAFVMETLSRADRVVKGMRPGSGSLSINLSGLTELDTGGAHLINRLRKSLADQGIETSLAGVSQIHADLLVQIAASEPVEPAPVDDRKSIRIAIEYVGEAVSRGIDEIFGNRLFFGQILVRLVGSIPHPGRFRFTSMIHHVYEAGISAVPIVALMAFLIGVVLAYMGSIQLRAFGAEVFVVDLVAIAVLRELGIMLTAIIVAGRSGSAFTAAIGSMKVREEVDAMRTLGLEPIDVLVIPRVLALIVMLPILGLLSDVAGILGGLLMSWIELGVSPGMFLTRLYESTDVWHYGVGIIKAPFFALVIALIGCFQGFCVGGSADSVGRQTTKSVVQAIFMVIVLDAFFAILFVELKI